MLRTAKGEPTARLLGRGQRQRNSTDVSLGGHRITTDYGLLKRRAT